MSEQASHWQLILARQPEKMLHRLAPELLPQIDRTLMSLAKNPFPAKSQPVANRISLYRLQVAGWRIIYAVEADRLVVLVLEIAPQPQPERYQVDAFDEVEPDVGVEALPDRAEMEGEAETKAQIPLETLAVWQTFLQEIAALQKQAPESYESVRADFFNLFNTAWERLAPDQRMLLLNPYYRRRLNQKIRVLIVDDNPETRENLRKLLHFASDIEIVGAATDGQEAIQKALDLRPDIILMDVLMPGLDGISAVETIYRQTPTIKTIMMSVQGDSDTFRRALMAGAKHFLVKPFSSDELLQSIRRVYAQGRSETPSEEEGALWDQISRRDDIIPLLDVIKSPEAKPPGTGPDLWLEELIAGEAKFIAFQTLQKIIISRLEDEAAPLTVSESQEVIRLLIVDNDPLMRRRLHHLFLDVPDINLVGIALEGREAIQKVDKLAPDIVLADVDLPNLDGFKICRRIYMRKAKSQVILMSASGDGERPQRAIYWSGAREFLLKSLSDETFIRSIRRVYEMARRVREAETQVMEYEVDERIERDIRVLVVDDQAQSWQDLQNMVIKMPGVILTGVANHHSQTTQLTKNLQPDVVLSNMTVAQPQKPKADEPVVQVQMVHIQNSAHLSSNFMRSRVILRTPFSKAALINGIRQAYLAEPDDEDGQALAQFQKKEAIQTLKAYKLGQAVEITLSVTDLNQSLEFYKQLGLDKVEGDETPYPWAVVSDGMLHLGLQQRPFSSPMLTYFSTYMPDQLDALQKIGIPLEQVQRESKISGMQAGELLKREFMIAAEFETPDGHRVALISQNFEVTPNLKRNFFASCDQFGELSFRTEDVDAAVAEWQRFGFERVAQKDKPYPWAMVTDGLIRLGLHQTTTFSRPTISYFAPNMSDRLAQLRQVGVQFIVEHKDKKGRCVGAALRSPDGQPFFLFTGQIKNAQEKTLDIFQLYEKHIGLVPPTLADELKEVETAYPPHWIAQAFQVAAQHNATWVYVRAILEQMASGRFVA